METINFGIRVTGKHSETGEIDQHKYDEQYLKSLRDKAKKNWLGTINPDVPMLYEGGKIDAHPVSLAQMTNICTTVQLRNAAPLLYSICWQQYF